MARLDAGRCGNPAKPEWALFQGLSPPQLFLTFTVQAAEEDGKRLATALGQDTEVWSPFHPHVLLWLVTAKVSRKEI